MGEKYSLGQLLPFLPSLSSSLPVSIPPFLPPFFSLPSPFLSPFLPSSIIHESFTLLSVNTVLTGNNNNNNNTFYPQYIKFCGLRLLLSSLPMSLHPASFPASLSRVLLFPILSFNNYLLTPSGPPNFSMQAAAVCHLGQ